MLRSTLLPIALVAAAPVTAADLLVTSWNTSSVLRYDDVTGAFLGVLVPSGAGGLVQPHSATIGPDGALYVTSFGSNEVLRFDAQTGAPLGPFVTAGSGQLTGPTDAFFGPDGSLLVASRGPQPGVKRYDGTTGAFLGQFIGPGNGMVGTETGNFGPDGHYYLASGANSQINRYDGLTGAFIDVFVPPGSGGLNDPHDLAWGPDGNLYVTSFGARRVKQYSGVDGSFQGNFVTLAGGLQAPHGIDFRPDGLLYVANFQQNTVRRFDGTTGAFVDVFISPGAGGVSGVISMTFTDADTLSLLTDAGTYRAWEAAPGEQVLFLVGLGQGSRPLCPGGPVVGLDRVALVATGVADSQGVAVGTWNAPVSVSGLPLLMQAAAPASCRTSDVLWHRVP